ncbi:MAG: YitT family protein [Limnochordaceae bacterium]|nr:YitT family protein [Limnochordaceae bacterium]
MFSSKRGSVDDWPAHAHRRPDLGPIVRDLFGILIGGAITAAGLDLFLIPAKIAAGGVSGLATVIHYVVGGSVGTIMLLFNIPLFLAGMRYLGAHFGVKTLWGAVTLSVLVDVFAPYMSPLTHDPLLASIYGGAVTGIGMGLTFRFGGTTGGTDIGAALLRHFTPLTVGQGLMVLDGAVILLAGLTFGPELALYALLTVFISARTIDLVQEGPGYAKCAYIISNDPERISTRILQEMERGVTALRGVGKYTGTPREVLMVIVSRSEITKLKEVVQQVDPKAFVVISDAREVLGEGFDERFRTSGPS